MGNYAYIALDKAGKEVRGTTDAPDEQALMDKLTGLGFYTISVRQHRASATRADLLALPGIRLFFHRIKSRHLMMFTRQLATLIDAGLPIVRALMILRMQVESVVFKEKIGDMIATIENGGSLSDACARHGKVFPPLYVNMVRAGEIGGALEQVLNRLADFLEKGQALKGKVRSALMYPAVVAALATIIVTFIIVKIIPHFEEIFRQLGGELPLLTQWLINVSYMLGRHAPLFIVAGVLAVVIFKQLNKTEHGRFLFDTLKLKMYIIGPILRKLAIVRFSGTLSTLIHAGVPILQALDIVRNTSGNEVISRAVGVVYESVKNGDTIHEPLERSGVFPPVVTQMIAVGEETGAIDLMLQKVSEAYEREVDDIVNALTSIIEPLLIVFLGAIVGVIVTALYLPLFNMGSLLQ